MGSVSREQFEDMRAQRDDFRQRYDTLLAQYHSLRLEGANLPYPKAEKAEIDEVTQAIIARSFGSKLLRKQYAQLVTMRRAVGTPEHEIAAEILRGESDADDAMQSLGSVEME